MIRQGDKARTNYRRTETLASKLLEEVEGGHKVSVQRQPITKGQREVIKT